MSTPNKKQHAIIMWVIWFAYLQSTFAIHFVLGNGFPQGENSSEPMATWLWLATLCPPVIATAIRWGMLPRAQVAKQQIVMMIIGLALSELPIFLSLFLVGSDYPQNQIVVLMVAVFSIIQFAPSYATPGFDLKQ